MGRRAKHAKRSGAGQKLPKGESLYRPALAEQAKTVILELQPIKANGGLHCSKLAKVLGIPSRTFRTWRNSHSEYYKPELVKALAEGHEELTESIELSKTKRAMIARSQPYIRIKRFKELRKKGPKMPVMSVMDKKALLLCAKKLGLKVNKTLTKDILQINITEAVEKQTEEVLVTTRQEEERMHGDVAAGKLVTSNIGPKGKRWVPDKSQVDGNLNLTLAEAVHKAMTNGDSSKEE